MCLSQIYKGKLKSAIINNLEVHSDGYIHLWKVFGVNNDSTLTGQFKKHTFWEGKNTALHRIIRSLSGRKEYEQYPSGFHCFASKRNALDWRSNSNRLYSLGTERIDVSIKVRKSWIVTVGKQSYKDVFVCKHIII